jgi:hypothetical protein
MRTLDHFDFRPKPSRPITKTEIDAAQAPSLWDLGNRVLYNLCRDHPKHVAADEIVAKIWLIGRSYAASIERRKNAIEVGEEFYEASVAPAMKASAIDQWLAACSVEDSPGIPKGISIHKQLMDLFASITELDKRSLASKYLHFHLPNAFFIYDSRAKTAITKVVPRLDLLPGIAAETFDKEYKDFVRRCVWLRNEIYSTHSVLLTPRQIDKLLLAITGPKTGV